MNASELRDKSIAELKNELIALRHEQLSVRVQRAFAPLSASHLPAQLRKNIARIKTVMTEKMKQQVGGNDE